jgi:hypothetical protein
MLEFLPVAFIHFFGGILNDDVPAKTLDSDNDFGCFTWQN